jgi:hypothetical protein
MGVNRSNAIVGAIVAVVLIAALAAVVGMRIAVPSDSAELRAVVHDSDGNAYEMPLSEDAEKTIQTSLGTNVVVVQDGVVFVRDADCENHDCIHQGKLDAPGGQIICLPHELWIEVVADDQSTGHMDTSAVAGSGSEDFDAVAR